MSYNELLLEISKMLDPIREGISQFREELGEVREDISQFKEELGEVREDIREIREDISEIREDINKIESRVKTIELTLENQIFPRLNTIEACYTSTFDRYKNSVEDYESIRQDIGILKNVVTEHSEKLQKLA